MNLIRREDTHLEALVQIGAVGSLKKSTLA